MIELIREGMKNSILLKFKDANEQINHEISGQVNMHERMTKLMQRSR